MYYWVLWAKKGTIIQPEQSQLVSKNNSLLLVRKPTLNQIQATWVYNNSLSLGKIQPYSGKVLVYKESLYINLTYILTTNSQRILLKL